MKQNFRLCFKKKTQPAHCWKSVKILKQNRKKNFYKHLTFELRERFVPVKAL